MAEGIEVIKVSTIGFTKSSAQRFFDRLTSANVRKLIDVRLHNTSQLSGFAKADDLAFFLRKISGIDYQHMPILAPEEGMLAEYKKGSGSWEAYAERFLDLMARRKIEERIDRTTLDGACLLCSESTPHHCHRRLVCEYLNDRWDQKLTVRHL